MAAEEQNSSFLNIGGRGEDILLKMYTMYLLTVGVFENIVTTVPIKYLNISSYFLVKSINLLKSGR